jgi:hypothetical protein
LLNLQNLKIAHMEEELETFAEEEEDTIQLGEV